MTIDITIIRLAGKVFFTALILSVVITPLTIYLANWMGAIDYPDDERKHHARAVPRLGGVSITVAIMTPFLLFLPFNHERLGMMIGAGIIAIVGFLDDLIQLRAIFKLAAQLVAVSCFVFIGGVSLTGFGNLFGHGDIETGVLAPWVTIFCIVGVINALNLSDGLDGLAAGYTVIAGIFLSVFAFDNHDWSSLFMLLALIGGALGFLRYNTHPAHLFMGDLGSMMLGYGLATIAVMLAQPVPETLHATAPITIAIVLALPIMDTLLVMGRRMLNGKSPFSPDRTHLHHRLIALGLPHDQVVMLLYTVMALFGSLALVAKGEPDWLQFIIGLIVVVVMFSGLNAFERMRPTIYGLRSSQLLLNVTNYTTQHTGWLQRNTRPCALVALMLIGVAAVGASPPLAAGTVVLYAVLISAILLYPWHPDREHATVQKGIVYLMLVTLFLSFQLHASVWLQLYLAVLALVALAIVLIRALSWDSDTRGSSSFQVLILLNMAIIPLVLMPLNDDSDSLKRVVIAFLEAVPVAWLINGYSVHIYRRNRRVTMVLFALVALMLLKAELHNNVLIHFFR